MNARIAIPSKQRLNSRTIQHMTMEGLRPIVYCHVDEEADYRYAYPATEIRVHHMDDLGAIRHIMLTEARVEGYDAMWQVDDDIHKVLRRGIDGKHAQCLWTSWLRSMEEELRHWPTVVVAGPRPIQYAWRETKPIANGHSNGIVLIRTHWEGVYRPFTVEDADIVLQAWTLGYHTVRWPDWAYDFPKMGTGKGGMEEAYLDGKLERIRAELIEQWKGSPLLAEDGIRLIRKSLTKPERAA